MGWESRGGNGPYYTRSKKVNGRVVREYIGRGRVGELVAAMDARERQQHTAQADADRRLIEEYEKAERLLAELCNSIDTLTRAVLYASGYHQHKHGEWRHKRGNKTQETS
jgi:hypothetical protein